MDKDRFSELAEKFFEGQTSERENACLRESAGETADQGFDEFCRKNWEQAEQIPDEKKIRMRTDMLGRIDEYEDQKKKSRSRIYRMVFGTAAAAAVILFSVFFGYQLSESRTVEQQYELKCENGQKSVLTLPDGTIVHLNSSSHLSYTSAYNNKVRNVSLSGEAYFDVARDEDKPFVVQAGDMQIEVLGTQFNVKAYEDDEGIEATLVEGSILAHVGDKEEILKPNERLSYNRNTGALVKTEELDPDRLVPWLENEIYFHHNSLSEIAVMLERIYDIEVKFEDECIGNYSYTGHTRNSSLKNILELISTTSPIDYTIDGDVITFKKR